MKNNLVKTILEKWCPRAVIAIHGAIRSRLFDKAPWGAPLKKKTVDAKKRRGSGAPSMALWDTGAFSRGMKFTMYVARGFALVFSEGKTKKQQEGFVLGNSEGHPANGRNPFKSNLPAAKGGNEKANTIAQVGKAIAATELAAYAKAQIRAAKKGIK